MKKLYTSIFIVILSISVASANDEFKKISSASEKVKAGTREMIRAGVDQKKAVDLTALMVENKFHQKNILKVHGIIIYAQKKKIPVDPIINKAFEGAAKRVRQELIVTAMERVQARYAFAYEHANRFPFKEEQRNRVGDTFAECLATGMTRTDMDDMVRALKRQMKEIDNRHSYELSMAVSVTVRDMKRLGVASDTALDIVGQMLQKGYAPENIKAIRERFIRDSKNTDPEYLAKQYLTAMKRGATADQLEDINNKSVFGNNKKYSGGSDSVTTRTRGGGLGNSGSGSGQQGGRQNRGN